MNENEVLLFKEYVADWIQKDKEIKECQKKLKTLQETKQNDLMPKIITFMKNNGIQELKTETSGKISLNTVKKRSAITKKTIKEKLLEELDEPVAMKIFNDLYDSREITENTNLTRK